MLARKLNFYLGCRDKAILCTSPLVHDPFKKMDEHRGKNLPFARKYFPNNRDSPRVLRVFFTRKTRHLSIPIHQLANLVLPLSTDVHFHPIRIIRDATPFLLPSPPPCKYTRATGRTGNGRQLYRQAIGHVTTTYVLRKSRTSSPRVARGVCHGGEGAGKEIHPYENAQIFR